MKHLLLIATVILSSPAFSIALDNGQILVEVQKRYEAVETFEAHFIQRSYIKVMDQTQESEGEVIIKKPGKMKWTYNAPDPQVLTSNNETLWLYVPEEKQVTKASIKDIYTTNTPARFLSGKGLLTESFKVDKILKKVSTLSIFLIPKKQKNDLQQLVLFANNKNYQIVGSRVYDRLGNKTEIIFSNIRINLDAPDEIFDFKTPEGADLLDTTAQSE